MIRALKRLSPWLTCALMLACAPLGAAGIYKQELPDGTVLYSDQPRPGAEEVRPPPPQVIESFRPFDFPRARGPDEPPPGDPYARLAITAPVEDEVIWSNERLVEVDVAAEPPVRDGHALLILLDGEPVARATSGTRFVLQNVFRGTHLLEAVIEGPDGEVLQRSGPVTFHMRQHSILAPTGPRP